METGYFWVQLLDGTVLFTYNWSSALLEPPRMHSIPPLRMRSWNPSYNRYGYEIPPRRRSQRANARRPVPVDAASYSYETLEQQNFVHANNQNRRDGSCLSEECISEYLIRSLNCQRTKEEICTICQDEIEMEEEMATLSCYHVYHKRCIKKWLMIKNECAVCRASAIPING